MMEGKKLEVYYHGNCVGILAQTQDKRIAFQYSDEWLRNGFSISPLSLPLREGVFVPKESSRDIFRGLFGVFADSLPDTWGELLFDRYLEAIGISSGDITVLDRLAYVGTAGMGALEYRPSRRSEYDIGRLGLNYDEIAEECSRLISSNTSDRLDVLYNLGGSSGGTRPKILLNEDDRDWIIKFPAQTDPAISGKREYDYSLCAQKSGIIMAETQLLKSDICEGYFKTERFDRVNGEKVMTVSFAGLLEVDFRAPSCDYYTYMKLIRALTKDNAHDLEQMYRLMCFNVMTHNRDDHTRNFSFRYTDDNGWRLAPAYDLTYSDTYFGEQTTSVNGKGKSIADEDLIKVGIDAGMKKKKCSEILDQIQTEVRSLDNYLSGKPSPAEKSMKWKDRISELNN